MHFQKTYIVYFPKSVYKFQTLLPQYLKYKKVFISEYEKNYLTYESHIIHKEVIKVQDSSVVKVENMKVCWVTNILLFLRLKMNNAP